MTRLTMLLVGCLLVIPVTSLAGPAAIGLRAGYASAYDPWLPIAGNSFRSNGLGQVYAITDITEIGALRFSLGTLWFSGDRTSVTGAAPIPTDWFLVPAGVGVRYRPCGGPWYAESEFNLSLLHLRTGSYYDSPISKVDPDHRTEVLLGVTVGTGMLVKVSPTSALDLGVGFIYTEDADSETWEDPADGWFRGFHQVFVRAGMEWEL